MRRRPRCLLAALIAAASGPLAAQPADLVEHVEVQRVNLEVFAVDADGAPVRDLAATDFAVFEDGQPVPLRNFSRIETAAGGPARAAPAAGQDAAADPQPSYVAFFLDELRPVSQGRREIFERLASTLSDSLPAGTEVMLVRYTGTPRVFQPFSSDRKVLADAVLRAGRTISSRLLEGDRERDEALENIREDAREGPCLFGDQIARAYAETTQRDALATAAALDWLVGSLAGLPGRKAIVYLGRGVPLQPGEEAWNTYLELCGGEGAARGVQDATDTALFGAARFHRPDPQKIRLESTGYDTSSTWSAVAARANGLGVSIYAFAAAVETPISPITAGGRAGSEITQGGLASSALDTLNLLVSETGARLSPATNPGALALLGADLASYYFLGYEPRTLASERIRSVRVEVGRPGVTLRYRKRVLLANTESRTSARLLTRLLYGVGDNPLGIRLASVPSQTAGRVELEVRVPLRSLTLLPGADGSSGSFVVYLALREADGRTTPVRRANVPVRVALSGASGQRDFVYRVTLPAAGDARQVAVAVRDGLGGETSFEGLTLLKSR